MKAFEGYYKMGDNNYIHIAAEEKGIILKQMWDGREIHFTAQSALEFLANDGNFPLKFTKGSDGTITQVLAFDKDLWSRTDQYKPPVVKTVHLNQSQLKACAGKYRFRFNGDQNDSYIQIRVIENNLVLKQSWDGKEFKFVPQSPLEFCVKDDPRFTLKFIKDSNGAVTQVLAFNRDLWNRVKE
ncbi:MAG: hypothetical protein Q8926_12525 [Bacteroidota bacterium]|nr:hypothetical protein [Bacteroidota bacterium]